MKIIGEFPLTDYYVKSVQIRSFFWFVFSRIRTRYLPVFSRNTGKYGPEKTPYLNTFHTVDVSYHQIVFVEEVSQICSLKRCSQKFPKIHRRTTVLKSVSKTHLQLYEKKRLRNKYFTLSFAKISRKTFFKEYLRCCFCVYTAHTV